MLGHVDHVVGVLALLQAFLFDSVFAKSELNHLVNLTDSDISLAARVDFWWTFAWCFV